MKTLYALATTALVSAASADTPAQKTFEALKKLQGTWINGKGTKEEFKVVYKITGGGSTIIETQFPGMSHEMVSIYHLDGPDKLLLTHYCAAKNQPTMKLLPGATDKEFKFEFISGTNMKPSDVHIHNVHYRMLDKNHVISEWGMFAEGKAGGVNKFDLHRVKA